MAKTTEHQGKENFRIVKNESEYRVGIERNDLKLKRK